MKYSATEYNKAMVRIFVSSGFASTCKNRIAALYAVVNKDIS